MNKLVAFFSEHSDSETLYIIGPLAKSLPEVSEPVLYIDGGAKFQKEGSGFSVGDGDSFSGKLDYVLPQEKDYSDLAFALNSIHNHFSKIHLIGFLGERRDHELMNLGEVSRFLSDRTGKTTVFFDHEIIAFSKGSYSVKHQGLFSLFSFYDTEISISGDCKYSFSGILKGLSSHGLSNSSQGIESLSLETSKALFLFMN